MAMPARRSGSRGPSRRTRGLSAISGYGIEWSADGNAPWNEVVADTGSTATEYIDGGLGSEVTRHYRVRAINGQGPGSASGTAEATTADIVPPVPVSAAVPASGTGLNIAFNEDLDFLSQLNIGANLLTVTADGVEVSFDPQSNDGTGKTFRIAEFSPAIRRGQTVVVTYRDPTAGDDILGQLEDLAGNDAATFTTGADGVPAVVNGSTVAPVAPGKVLSLAAVPGGSTAIVLTWDAPADNGGRVIASYRIEGCASACETESNWEVEAAEHATTVAGMVERRWVDAGLAAATTRHYRVRAKNEVNAGAWSDSASATTSTASVPGAPTGLTATAQDADRADGETEIALAWTRPGNQGDSNVAGYRIEWSSDGRTDWTELGDGTGTGTTATAFIDDMLASETTRHYRVSAINTQGTGPPSGSAHATTADVAAPVPVTALATGSELIVGFDEPLETGDLAVGAFTVTASGQTLAYDEVEVDPRYPRDVALFPHPRPIRTGEAVVVTYADPTAGDDASSVIQDLAGNDAASFTTGEGGVPAVNTTEFLTLVPVAPGKVRSLAAAPASGTSIALAWDAPADNGGRPVASYRIEVCTQRLRHGVELVGGGRHPRRDGGRRHRAALRAHRAVGRDPPLPGRGAELGGPRRLVGHRGRHRRHGRPGRPDGADGDGAGRRPGRRRDGDRARLDKACGPGGFERHRLPGRAVGRRPHGLDGAGGRHRDDGHGLHRQPARLGGDAPLPGLGDQRPGHGPAVRERACDHGRRRGAPRGLGGGARVGQSPANHLRRGARRDGGEPAAARQVPRDLG